MRTQLLWILLLSLTAVIAQEQNGFSARATYYTDGTALACGVPRELYDHPYVVALNANGIYQGGRNCGRFMKVTFGQACVGGNYELEGGCKGQLVDDATTGKTIYLQVQDACGFDDSWCSNKDSYHLDMTVNTLALIGKTPSTWDNRKVSWEWVNHPSYTKDKLYFGFGGNPYWPKVVFTGLLNGVSRVDRLVDGQWKQGRIIGINGLTYNLDVPSGNMYDFVIRVFDGDGNQYPGTYNFQYPKNECGDQCNRNVELNYTRGNFQQSKIIT